MAEGKKVSNIITSIVVFLVVVSLIISAYFYINFYLLQKKEKEDPYAPQDGFTGELKGPIVTPGEFSTYEEIPFATADSAPGYSYSMEWNFLGNTIYQYAGSVMKMSFNNTGTREVFIYEYGLEVDWSGEVFKERTGRTIDAGGSRYLGMAAFEGPDTTGEHDYKLGISFMAKDDDGKWYDFGWTAKTSRSAEVEPLGSREDYVLMKNPRKYFGEVNSFFNEQTEAANKAQELVEDLPPAYSIYQICRIYDHVNNNIQYVSDPADKDEWCNPDKTLERMGGDCEDQAFLVAEMIRSLGGSVRIHFTETHAYASVYIGSNNSVELLSRAVGKYYGVRNTQLDLATYFDEFGNWLILDATVGFFPGAPMLDAEPMGPDRYWDLTGTDYLINIDIVPGSDK